jgi:crotonobetainyl-CoA:carnitine CoA-transferase CaiB-like acyl-CoA transferase
LADGITGAFAVSGILAALIEQRTSGQGQFVDVSMADCLLSLVLDEPLDCYDRLGLVPLQGNRIMRFSPFNTFRLATGRSRLLCHQRGLAGAIAGHESNGFGAGR